MAISLFSNDVFFYHSFSFEDNSHCLNKGFSYSGTSQFIFTLLVRSWTSICGIDSKSVGNTQTVCVQLVALCVC